MFNFKKILIILTVLCVLFFSISTVGYSDKPNISAQSSILIEAKSGRILYSNNLYKKMPMASTTKIMTALLAIEHGKLDEKVKIKNNAVGIEGSSIYLYNKEEISLEDLIYGLMLRSGNDAATAIATHISGSVEDFVELMNEKAKEIGAYDTNFTNPHGLHNKNHYTTAYDLAMITREAMKHKKFREVSGTKLWVADRDINKYFYNKNKTLWQYNGGDGVKIGYTTASGRCLVSSATVNGMQLIAVVLNAPDWFKDCYKLFDYGFENYTPMAVYSKNQLIKSLYISNGQKETLNIVTENSMVLPLKENEVEDIKVLFTVYKNVKAPIRQGEKLGKIKVFIKGNLISVDNLIAKETIKEKGIFDKINEFFSRIF